MAQFTDIITPIQAGANLALQRREARRRDEAFAEEIRQARELERYHAATLGFQALQEERLGKDFILRQQQEERIAKIAELQQKRLLAQTEKEDELLKLQLTFPKVLEEERRAMMVEGQPLSQEQNRLAIQNAMLRTGHVKDAVATLGQDAATQRTLAGLAQRMDAAELGAQVKREGFESSEKVATIGAEQRHAATVLRVRADEAKAQLDAAVKLKGFDSAEARAAMAVNQRAEAAALNAQLKAIDSERNAVLRLIEIQAKQEADKKAKEPPIQIRVGRTVGNWNPGTGKFEEDPIAKAERQREEKAVTLEVSGIDSQLSEKYKLRAEVAASGKKQKQKDLELESLNSEISQLLSDRQRLTESLRHLAEPVFPDEPPATIEAPASVEPTLQGTSTNSVSGIDYDDFINMRR